MTLDRRRDEVLQELKRLQQELDGIDEKREREGQARQLAFFVERARPLLWCPDLRPAHREARFVMRTWAVDEEEEEQVRSLAIDLGLLSLPPSSAQPRTPLPGQGLSISWAQGDLVLNGQDDVLLDFFLRHDLRVEDRHHFFEDLLRLRRGLAELDNKVATLFPLTVV